MCVYTHNYGAGEVAEEARRLSPAVSMDQSIEEYILLCHYAIQVGK
jgi:hypothetical protein